jgi:hypothetical protein
LECHGDLVGSTILLVIEGILLLVVAVVFLLLVQGYGYGRKFSACIIICSSVGAGDGDHLVYI